MSAAEETDDTTPPPPSLDLDCVTQILLHLAAADDENSSLHDLCNASQVGKTWREAANTSEEVWKEMLRSHRYYRYGAGDGVEPTLPHTEEDILVTGEEEKKNTARECFKVGGKKNLIDESKNLIRMMG